MIKVEEVCVCVRDLHDTRSDVLDLAAWWRTSSRALGRYWTPRWAADLPRHRWCCSGSRCLDPGLNGSECENKQRGAISQSDRSINPPAKCVGRHRAAGLGIFFFYLIFFPRGEGANPNTFTTAKLRLMALFYIQQPHYDIQPQSLIILPVTQSQKPDIASNALETHTHVHTQIYIYIYITFWHYFQLPHSQGFH